MGIDKRQLSTTNKILMDNLSTKCSRLVINEGSLYWIVDKIWNLTNTYISHGMLVYFFLSYFDPERRSCVLIPTKSDETVWERECGRGGNLVVRSLSPRAPGDTRSGNKRNHPVIIRNI